jgi:hypothetical protein
MSELQPIAIVHGGGPRPVWAIADLRDGVTVHRVDLQPAKKRFGGDTMLFKCEQRGWRGRHDRDLSRRGAIDARDCWGFGEMDGRRDEARQSEPLSSALRSVFQLSGWLQDSRGLRLKSEGRPA